MSFSGKIILSGVHSHTTYDSSPSGVVVKCKDGYYCINMNQQGWLTLDRDETDGVRTELWLILQKLTKGVLTADECKVGDGTLYHDCKLDRICLVFKDGMLVKIETTPPVDTAPTPKETYLKELKEFGTF